MTESNATLSRWNWRRAAEQSHMVILLSKAGAGHSGHTCRYLIEEKTEKKEKSEKKKLRRREEGLEGGKSKTLASRCEFSSHISYFHIKYTLQGSSVC